MTAPVTGHSRGNSLPGRRVNELIFQEKTPEANGQDGGHLVKALVEKGEADAGVRDRWGATPLLEAVKAKHPEVVAYLLSVPGGKGRDLGVSDSDLSGLLCTAVLENDLEVLKLFASAAGSKLDAGDYDKRYASFFFGD